MPVEPDTEHNRARAEYYRELAGAVAVDQFRVIEGDWDITLVFEIDGKRKAVRMRPTKPLKGESYGDMIIRSLQEMKEHAAHSIELYGAD